MSWYDLISPLYDTVATGYGRPRRAAIAQLRLEPGDAVLDIACGTGLNFPLIEAGIGPEGLLIGLDFSPGMLAKAQRRARRRRWENVRLIQADARALCRELLREHAGVDRVDKALCTLGFSVVPDWETVFERSWALVKPGGRYAMMDGWRGRRNPVVRPLVRLMEVVSRSDVTHRRCWAPLEAKSGDYSYTAFNYTPFVRAIMFVAAGTVPGAAA